jgi:hypothetical protein
MALLEVLLVLWSVAAVVGFAISGLVWIGIIAITLLVGTSVAGGLRLSVINEQQPSTG